jgi:hypothetical protein
MWQTIKSHASFLLNENYVCDKTRAVKISSHIYKIFYFLVNGWHIHMWKEFSIHEMSRGQPPSPSIENSFLVFFFSFNRIAEKKISSSHESDTKKEWRWKSRKRKIPELKGQKYAWMNLAFARRENFIDFSCSGTYIEDYEWKCTEWKSFSLSPHCVIHPCARVYAFVRF